MRVVTTRCLFVTALFVAMFCRASYAAKPAHEVSAKPIQVVVDGKPVKFERPPVMKSGTVMVPLRTIFEAFGAEVKFDNAAQRVWATKGTRVIEMLLGALFATVGGQLVKMPAPATNINGTIMVPLRFVTDVINAEMRFASTTNTYDIHGPPPETAAPPASKGPHIEQIGHNAHEPLDVGKSLRVVVKGDAGCQATFDIMGDTKPIVKAVPLREEEAGRYVGEVRVSPTLKVEKGKLLAHLVKDDQETTKEADKTVTLALPAETALIPEAGATVTADALAVGATFHKNVRPDSVHLSVDGSDVTAASQVTANGVTYHPPADIRVGPHGAALDAIAEDGSFLQKTWQFTVVVAPAPSPLPGAAPSPSPSSVAASPAEVSLVAPADGSTVQTVRPAIQAQFTQPVQPASVLVTVDGQKVDATVTNNNTTVVATLSTDIPPGKRAVTIIASDANGKPVNKGWAFTVAAPAQSGPPTVTVTTPVPGGTVHGSFHVQGATLPGAKVRLHVSLVSTTLFFTTEGKAINKDVVADASGHFDFQVEEKDLGDYKNMNIDVVAADNDGRESPTVRMKVTRK